MKMRITKPVPHEFRATITGRGQVTLPAAVRRGLGVNKGDRVTFRMRGKKVEVTLTTSNLDSVFASAKRPGGRQEIDRLIRMAKDAKAEETMRKLGSS